MKVRFAKTHPHSIIPIRSTEDAVGFDIFTPSTLELEPGKNLTVPTGIVCVIPTGYQGVIRSRSGLYFNHGYEAFHGTIDPDYRGELLIGLRATPYATRKVIIDAGRAIAQIVFSQVLLDSEEIPADDIINYRTIRGANGFGSTDRG